MLKNILALIFISIFSSTSFADYYYSDYNNREYEVTVFNITKGQTFTPVLSATHSPAIQFFELGSAASEPLAILAEAGNVAPLKEVLDNSDLVNSTTNTEGLLTPGNSVTFNITGNPRSRISLAAMLIPTNDTFFAINTAKLPRRGTRTYFAKAYDAGSENNDEICASIPRPACGGEGVSEADGEGYVHISAGIHGEAELLRSAYDWRDAVAKVVVRRVR